MKKYVMSLVVMVGMFAAQSEAKLTIGTYGAYQTDNATKNTFYEAFDLSTDLIRGYVAGAYGPLEIQRFFGNIKFERSKQIRACSYKDVGGDGMADLLILTHPSAGAAFNVSGIGALDEVFEESEMPQLVADMFYLANRVRARLTEAKPVYPVYMDYIEKNKSSSDRTYSKDLSKWIAEITELVDKLKLKSESIGKGLTDGSLCEDLKTQDESKKEIRDRSVKKLQKCSEIYGKLRDTITSFISVESVILKDGEVSSEKALFNKNELNAIRKIRAEINTKIRDIEKAKKLSSAHDRIKGAINLIDNFIKTYALEKKRDLSSEIMSYFRDRAGENTSSLQNEQEKFIVECFGKDAVDYYLGDRLKLVKVKKTFRQNLNGLKELRKYLKKARGEALEDQEIQKLLDEGILQDVPDSEVKADDLRKVKEDGVHKMSDGSVGINDNDLTVEGLRAERIEKLYKLGKAIVSAVTFERFDDSDSEFMKWHANPYTLGYTNDIISSFAWFELNNKIDLDKLANALKSNRKRLKDEFITNETNEELKGKINALIDSRPKSSFTADVHNDEDFRYTFPFSNPVTSNGDAYYNGNKFADCVETALRLLFCTIFSTTDGVQYNIDFTRMPDGSEVKKFFKNQKQGITEICADTSSETRTDWAKLCEGLKNQTGIDYMNSMDGDDYEMNSGWRNIIVAFCWIMRNYPSYLKEKLGAEYDSSAPVITRQRNAAVRIEKIVKALQGAGEVAAKRQVIKDEIQADGDNGVARILNDLFGIRTDVQLVAHGSAASTNGGLLLGTFQILSSKEFNEDLAGEEKESLGLQLADVKFYTIKNHAQWCLDHKRTKRRQIRANDNTGFYNTEKLYSKGGKTYNSSGLPREISKSSYPHLDFYMRVGTAFKEQRENEQRDFLASYIGHGDNPVEDVVSKLLRCPYWSIFTDGICKLVSERGVGVTYRGDTEDSDQKLRRLMLNFYDLNKFDTEGILKNFRRVYESGQTLPLDVNILEKVKDKLAAVLENAENVIKHYSERHPANADEEKDLKKTIKEALSIAKFLAVIDWSSVKEDSSTYILFCRWIQQIKNIIGIVCDHSLDPENDNLGYNGRIQKHTVDLGEGLKAWNLLQIFDPEIISPDDVKKIRDYVESKLKAQDDLFQNPGAIDLLWFFYQKSGEFPTVRSGMFSRRTTNYGSFPERGLPLGNEVARKVVDILNEATDIDVNNLSSVSKNEVGKRVSSIQTAVRVLYLTDFNGVGEQVIRDLEEGIKKAKEVLNASRRILDGYGISAEVITYDRYCRQNPVKLRVMRPLIKATTRDSNDIDEVLGERR